MGKNYKQLNAQTVLERVNALIDSETDLVYHNCRGYKMTEVCDELSIFDWFVDYLSMTKLKDMRKFLEVAISEGYRGYVCFKVGASGCANGMWAHLAETEDGYSPDGEFLYKSFTPSYNCWTVYDKNGIGHPERDKWNSIKTESQVRALIASLRDTSTVKTAIVMAYEQARKLTSAIEGKELGCDAEVYDALCDIKARLGSVIALDNVLSSTQ